MPLLRHRDRIEGDLVIEVAFTDVSLSLGDAADPAVRVQALALLTDESGATPVVMHQVHGSDTVLVDQAGADPAPSCDAIYTSQPGVALLARAAPSLWPLLYGTYTVPEYLITLPVLILLWRKVESRVDHRDSAQAARPA